MVSGSSASTKQSVATGLHHPPLFDIIAGCALLVVWLLGNGVQVQTSEAWMTAHSFSLSVVGGFSVYGQLVQLFTSTNTPVQVVSYMFAWSVQLAYMVLAIEVKLPNTKSVKALWCGIVLMVVLNSIGDFNYAATAGFMFWAQLGFAGAMFVSSLGFGLFGVSTVARGVAGYHA